MTLVQGCYLQLDHLSGAINFVSCVKNAAQVILLLPGLMDELGYHLLGDSVFLGNISLLLELDHHLVDDADPVADGQRLSLP